MNYGNEQMQVEFHNRAAVQFFSIYHGFEDAVSNVSRRNDEYKFQQLKKQYAAMMERELYIIAKNVLTKYRNAGQDTDVSLVFHRHIQDYLHRFIQKVNDL